MFALLALVITAAMLTWAALFALHRIYGHGTWQIGTSSRSVMGLQHQPDVGIISI